MNNLTKLFKLVELTRSQPQYGYALAGIPKGELSDLAQHHYLVAFIAWQLARDANRAGAKLNVEKVLEYALVHDLGELLGGDIAGPYAVANRRAYRAAKAFETENHKFLSKYFGSDKKYFLTLTAEIMKARNDEAFYAKAADWIECTHYKFYLNRFNDNDAKLAKKKLESYIKGIKDPLAKSWLKNFLQVWLKELPHGTGQDAIIGKK